MVGMFRVTFDTVTPESAEYGDSESRGFVLSGGGLEPIDELDSAAIRALDVNMTLSEALRLMGGVTSQGTNTWYEAGEGRVDYRTGACTTYALHGPRKMTAASIGRVERALKAARLL